MSLACSLLSFLHSTRSSGVCSYAWFTKALRAMTGLAIVPMSNPLTHAILLITAADKTLPML